MAQKRKLFEEVGEASAPAVETKTGMIDSGKRGARGAIRVWLMVLFALVTVRIVVGGLTRLTDSGLSITEWKPISGALPPMSADAWEAEFELYKQIPEYQLQNNGMTLGEFKSIYWWEWGHRQLGRVIGLVWAIGFFGFLAARQIPVGWTKRLLFVGILGGIQGAVGWWMVSSGLGAEMLDVASERLAIHLGIAVVILAYLTWFILLLSREERDLMQARRLRDKKLFTKGTGLMHFAFLQIILGALAAGTDAGTVGNDWPLMGGAFFPEGGWDLRPGWRNFVANPEFIQFIHRILAYILLAYGTLVWLRARKSPNGDTRFRFNLVFAMLIMQAVLGILTVLYIAPMHLALAHQIGGILLWVLILRARFGAAYPKEQSVRG